MISRILWVSVAVCLLVGGAASGQPAVNPQQDIHFLKADGEVQRGVRCATRPVGRHEAALVESELAAFRQSTGFAPGQQKQIPVAFHVVYSESRNGQEGNVPPEWIDAQIAVLNDAYQGRGFSFTLASVDYTLRNSWFRACYGADRPRARVARPRVER